MLSKAAALALYSALGLAPLVLLLLTVTRWLGPETEEAVVSQVESIAGNPAGKEIREIVKSTKQEHPREAPGTLSAVVGLAMLLFSASGIFAQLQTTLNNIWGVKPKPPGGLWIWLRARLLSLGTLLSALFLLLVSLVVSAGVALTVGQSGVLWHLLNLAVSI
ncbi:MAG: YhjD/YihY/BrkB family envelope integrity protein, partial [Thermoguttaceae bacterium]